MPTDTPIPTHVPADIQAVLDTPYELTAEQIDRFRADGFVKLPGFWPDQVLDFFDPVITRLTLESAGELKPIEQRDTYSQAFIQVGNLWTKNDVARAFACSKRGGRAAAELLGTTGTRMWHDQALYKEPAGGFTPWHVDQQYWPMSSGLSVTQWCPFTAVPLGMGPLCFGRGSHLKNIGRDVAISDESERIIRDAIKQHGVVESFEPYEKGEVSYHYGWTLHRAGGNTTDQPRRVFTVIYMDEGMKLAEPKNQNQKTDWESWTPSTKVGRVMDDALNPVLYSSADSARS